MEVHPNNVFILFPFLLTFSLSSADKIIFQEQQRVYYTEEYLHVILDLDFSPIVEECKALAPKMNLLKETFNMVHSDTTRALRAYYEQACSITKHWETHERHERQALLLGLLGATSLFGVLTKIEIGHLNSKIDQMDQRVRRGLVILNKHETRIAVIESSFNKLSAKILWDIVYLQNYTDQIALIQDVALHVSALHAHTAAISRSWIALTDNHLSWDLINPEQWAQVMSRIQAEATKLGGQLPAEDKFDLLQFPVSFQAHGPFWRLILTLPVVQEEIHLYKHLPIPLYLDDPSNSSARIVSLTSTTDLLLVLEDDSLHREISRAELESLCHRVGTRYICPDLGVLHRHLEDTCLGALFAKQTAEALKICHMAEVKQEWLAMPISSDSVVIYSKKGRGLDSVCKNGTRRPDWIQGVKEVRLEQSCVLSSKDFLIRRSAAVQVRMHVVAQPMWDAGALEEAWARTLERAHSRTELVRAQIEETKIAPRPAPELQADHDWLASQVNPHTPEGRRILIGLLSAAAGLALLLGALMIFLCWRFLKTPPPVNRPAGDAGQAAG
jgi:hypothetical protein